MDPSSNFSNYRTALRGATQRSETAHSSQEKVREPTLVEKKPQMSQMQNVNTVASFLQIVIPFFSLLIKDIYFLNEGCASRLSNGHINFEVSPQVKRMNQTGVFAFDWIVVLNTKSCVINSFEHCKN